MSKRSVFIATSLDGFIAREDGGIDWLPEPEPGSNEDFGYYSFIKDIDAIVMGRNSFELVLSFNEWHYGEMPVCVLTNKGVEIPEKLSKTVFQLAGEPQEIIDQLAAKGYHNLYIDGGKTIRGFLNDGLIDEMIITKIPVLIGTGIPLFGPLKNDIQFDLIQSESMGPGMVQSHYKVIN